MTTTGQGYEIPILDIHKLVKHVMQKEMEDWAKTDLPDPNHIFMSIARVDRWLNDFDASVIRDISKEEQRY